MSRTTIILEDGLRMVTDGHLGGYVVGGDPNTTYPKLWATLVAEEGIRSVLDIGCGDGLGALAYFHDTLGLQAQGIDGIADDPPNPWIWKHDYADGPIDGLGDREWDLVWSAEFVEHLVERDVPSFLSDFARGQLVAMTHALPGQAGWHHVNCRTSDYWIGALAAIGYTLDDTLTVRARRLALTEPTIPVEANYFGRSGLIFRRNP